MNFPWLVYELNREMIDASARIDAPHNWASKHYQWVRNEKGVLYWHEADEVDTSLHRRVYILGNPMVIWGVAAAVVAAVVAGGLYLRYHDMLTSTPTRSRLIKSACFAMCGYICNMAPYLAVNRQAFVYHYMPALFFGELLFCMLVDLLVPEVVREKVYIGCVVVVVAAFIYWMPWAYALPLTQDGLHARQWMSTWH